MNELSTQIKNIIEELNPYADVDENTQLVDEGIIDSMMLYGVITACEDAFDVEIPDDEINKENFATLGAMEKLISGLINSEAEK